MPKRGNPGFEALRSDKTELPTPTAREYQIANFNIACKMIECFSYRPWMSGQNVIGWDEERLKSCILYVIPLIPKEERWTFKDLEI